MQKIGIGFWLGMAVLAGLTLGCAYLACLGMQVGDESGPWLFGAFGVLFGIPFLAGVLRIASTRSSKMKSFYLKATGVDRSEATRFVPHWFTMAAVIIAGLALLYGLVMWIL